MKVLITSVPLLGHLNAVLSVGRILKEEGHDIIGLSATVFRDRIEHIGAKFIPFSGTADLDLRDFAAAYPECRSMAPGVEMTRFYLERVFADPLVDQSKSIQAILNEYAPDLIIADNLFLGVLPLLLGPLEDRPPIVYVGSTYLLWHRPDDAPINLALPPAANGTYAEIAREVDKTLFQPFGAYLNGILSKVGAPALSMNLMDAVVALPDAFSSNLCRI